MLNLSDFKGRTEERKKIKFFGKAKLQILIGAAILTIALVFGQLVFANNLATDGEKLAQIEEQIQKFEDKNTTLKKEIAQKTSLTQLSKKAQDEGFSRPSKIIRPR